MSRIAGVVVGFGLVCGWSAPTKGAEDSESTSSSVTRALNDALDNAYYKLHLNTRIRFEFADFDRLNTSQAYTVRMRLGIETKPFYGLSLYVEGENLNSFAESKYFDAVEAPTGQAAIADPEATELNQLLVRYQNAELFGLDIKGGRQRIKFDDDRFIGNVGWRQNEQTYDAALVSFSPGLKGLTASYGYIWDVRRIFGDQGPPNRRDFDSDSHIIRFAYAGIEGMKVVAFAYLLDFKNSPGNSSNSFGFRVTGHRAVAESLTLNYVGSYALQTDAAANPVDYTAHYVAVQGGLAHTDFGAMDIGYELLSSDGGRARFVTPLATAHKFNGWADVFLNNGGTRGLHDLYVSIGPRLPFGIKGKLIYHRFWSDQGRNSLGGEIDMIISKQVNRFVQLLSKGAWFDGTGKGPRDGWRFSVETNLTY